jgi:flagellar motor switch protein FliM
MHTQFASIATPSEIVVATTFSVDLGGGSCEFHICIPYASVEPIRDALYRTLQADQSEPDRRWLRMLSSQVQAADIELMANLAKITVTVRQLLNMKVGDVIGLDLPKTVVAECDGVPVFECGYGTTNGRRALKIAKSLSNSSEENMTRDDHAY